MEYSKEIERFLNFIRQSKTDYGFYYEEVNKCDNESNDLLHQIEIGKSKDRNRFATELSKVRKRRRHAKDEVEITLIIKQWSEKHMQGMRELEKTLGEVRKIERKHKERKYMPRVRKDLKI